ncbi:hypothetical protein ACHWQZ_G011214 [Mnemiopsis leidyi]
MELSEIKAMKVVELKKELESRGLPKPGTKAVLVDRLFQDMELSEIKEMKVVELKKELESRGLPKSGTKAVLVERLFQAIQGKAEENKTS